VEENLMRGGALKKPVTIQLVTETSDSKGGIIETWTQFAKTRAGIEPLVGREFFDSKQVNADISTKIRIRYVAGINTKMRLLFGARIFEILSIVDIKEGGREMILMCREDV